VEPDQADKDEGEYEKDREGYGGGPSDMSLLHDYHKHMEIQIWVVRHFEDPV
jgi:hypothetical protein